MGRENSLDLPRAGQRNICSMRVCNAPKPWNRRESSGTARTIDGWSRDPFISPALLTPQRLKAIRKGSRDPVPRPRTICTPLHTRQEAFRNRTETSPYWQVNGNKPRRHCLAKDWQGGPGGPGGARSRPGRLGPSRAPWQHRSGSPFPGFPLPTFLLRSH